MNISFLKLKFKIILKKILSRTMIHLIMKFSSSSRLKFKKKGKKNVLRYNFF
jgi:hypothetical protein